MRQAETYLLTEERIRQFALAAVRRAPLGKEIVIQDEKRTPEQNKRLWSQLSAIADSGLKFDGATWDAESWKDILLHAFLELKKMETGSAHKGLEGGIVILGRLSSSRLTKKQFAEWMEMIDAFIVEHNITWEERPVPVPDNFR